MDWHFKIGLGVTVVFGLLPFAVKNMPYWVTWIGIGVGVFLILWGIIPSKLTAKLRKYLIWWAIKKQIIDTPLQDDDFISLKKVCEELFGKLSKESSPCGYSLNYTAKKVYGFREELDRIGKCYAEVEDIYGKRPPFMKWEKIDRNEFITGEIKGGATKLYRLDTLRRIGTEPDFTDLVIRKSQFKEALGKAKQCYKDRQY